MSESGPDIGSVLPEPKVRGHVLAGLTVVLLLGGGIGVWAATATLSSAVIAPGLVVVDSNVKKVQHPSGGIIGAIHVKNGDRVREGDLLITLDDTITRANLGIVASQLEQLTGRRARLEAERDEAPDLRLPEGFEATGPSAREIAAGERRLFQARREASQRQKAQLGEQIGQRTQEIQGLTAQVTAKEKEIRLVYEEIERVDDMYRRNLLPITRLIALQRDAARIEGERGQLLAQAARAAGQISEIELQIIAIDQTLRTESMKELREAEAKIAELSERKIAAEDQLRRIDIRAPYGGVVHELAVHTIGGVINSAEGLMLIVPSEEALVIEVRIAPGDIDQVKVGSTALLRFPAVHLRTTPELYGTVTRLAADLTREPQTGQSYFIGRIKLTEEALRNLEDFRLQPGMPVEAFVQTGERTALSYLVKPLTDQIARALREK